MTILSVKVDKYLEGNITAAVSEIVSSSGDVAYRGPVPAGFTAAFMDVEVKPGDYLVRATLPSGEVVSHSATVGDTRVEVTLRGRGSKHEWLSWHEFSAGKGGESNDEDVFQLAPSSTSVADELRQGRAGGDLALFVVGRASTTATMPVPLEYQATIGGGGLKFRTEVHSDERFLVVRITAEAGGEVWVPGKQWPRVYLGASLPGSPYRIIALPVPWPDPEGGFEERTIEVLLNRWAGLADWSDPAGAVVSLVVRDPVFGPALSFLASGDPAAARTVSADLNQLARAMLWNKVSNPYAAAAGAYVLLRSGDGVPATDWHGWSENLAKWFPWLPDGAVIYGWQSLKDGSAGGLQAAREALIDATDRGIPVYTEGVRLLLQGLTILSREAAFGEDHGVETALRRARAFGVAVDPTKPFSTFSDTDARRHIPGLVLPTFVGPLGAPETVRVELSPSLYLRS